MQQSGPVALIPANTARGQLRLIGSVPDRSIGTFDLEYHGVNALGDEVSEQPVVDLSADALTTQIPACAEVPKAGDWSQACGTDNLIEGHSDDLAVPLIYDGREIPGVLGPIQKVLDPKRGSHLFVRRKGLFVYPHRRKQAGIGNVVNAAQVYVHKRLLFAEESPMLYQNVARFLFGAAAAAFLILPGAATSAQRHGDVRSMAPPPQLRRLLHGLPSRNEQEHSSGSTFTMGTGHLLLTYGRPRIALAGDADGDGRADFIGVDPQQHSVDFARMTTAGKLVPTVRARENIGGPTLAVACGTFTGGRGADTLALLADGSVVVAFDMQPGTKVYSRMATAAHLTPGLLPKTPVRAVTADFDGDGKPDVLLAGGDGRPLLLHNDRTANTAPHFTPQAISDLRISGRRLAAGDLKGAGKAEIVWIDAAGVVRRAGQNRTLHFDRPLPMTTASPDDGLAIGRFRGAKQADVIVGQRLLPGGDAVHALPLPNLPDAKRARQDEAWSAGDFNGDGKDDLLCPQGGGDPFEDGHVLVYYSHDTQDKATLQFDDSDNDGLPDAWETGAIQPGGLDLKSMGCSPRHTDVIVEVQRMEDVPEAQLRADMQKAVLYFASLPVKNADGLPGIALHLLYNGPIPLRDSGRPWWSLQGKYHAANHRGITHWMVVYNGGGGQSSQMGDGGSFGHFGMPAVFIHEFGHQLGLDHTGRWGPGWCPTFPSLMNYAYNYQLNGKAENIGFSDGRLSSVILNERHLDEYLPLPMDRISFLAGPPYRYRMKPAPDGKGTLIDWNWNGVFGEKDISADINYGYSTTGGERHVVCKTYTPPAMTALGDGLDAKLLLFYGLLAPGATPPAVDVKARNPSLSADQPGPLCLRVWQSKDPVKEGGKWTEETQVEAGGLSGEASATTFQQAAWVAYPTLSGVQVRRLTLDAQGVPQIRPPAVIPESRGVQPTLTSFRGRMALLLWRDRTRPVGLRWLDVTGDKITVTAETPLGFASNVPVGAAAGFDAEGKPALWIGLTQDQDRRRPSHWQIRVLTLQSDGTLRPNRQFWADGDQGQNRGEGRVTLLIEPNTAFGPEGRWYFLQRGGTGEDLGQDYIGMRIADTTMTGGCLTRRYYDEWTNSRGAPGVCWFRGDIALANRWFGDSPAYRDNNLYVGFTGRGIESENMGDFDELHEIREYGLSGSLPFINE